MRRTSIRAKGAMCQHDKPDQDGDGFNRDLPSDMFRSGDEVFEGLISMPRYFGLTDVEGAFTIIDGLVIHQGDIVLGTVEELKTAQAKGRGIGIRGENFRWPKGVIPYVVVPELKDVVEAAILEWKSKTPFKFVMRAEEEDYVSFEKRAGCWSQVGRRGGKQVISLGFGCGLGSAIHEIGHAIGLWHEQSRKDRDDHIKIVWENVDEQFKRNFDKHVQDGDDWGEYDYGSIMHYPPKAFSLNGEDTIVTANGDPIGQRDGLSAGDISAVKKMYPLLKWNAVPAAGGGSA